MDEYIGIILRISIVYVYVLTLLRISGKRSIDHLSPFDFMVSLILADMVEDVFFASISVAQGLVGVSTIFLLHTVLSFAEYKSDWIHHVISSAPTLVIKNARKVRDGMDRERTNEEELYSHLRLKGEEDMAEVKEAHWEPGGELSVLKKDPARPVQKSELEALKRVFR